MAIRPPEIKEPRRGNTSKSGSEGLRRGLNRPTPIVWFCSGPDSNLTPEFLDLTHILGLGHFSGTQDKVRTSFFGQSTEVLGVPSHSFQESFFLENHQTPWRNEPLECCPFLVPFFGRVPLLNPKPTPRNCSASLGPTGRFLNFRSPQLSVQSPQARHGAAGAVRRGTFAVGLASVGVVGVVSGPLKGLFFGHLAVAQN